jgi:hypothetical protein
MPSLPSYSRIIARLDAPDPSTTNAIIISAILACSAAILIIVMLSKYVGLPWWHSYKGRKTAKEKAVADRKAWYRSTRPIMRCPETPRIVNFYPRSPHIQGRQEVGSPAIDPPNDLDCSNASGNSDVLEQTEASHFADALPVILGPFLNVDLDHQPGMELGSGLGLQLTDKHHTGSTMSTVISVGVVVPLICPLRCRSRRCTLVAMHRKSRTLPGCPLLMIMKIYKSTFEYIYGI